MPEPTSLPQPLAEQILDINNKINDARDFNDALRIAAEEIARALHADHVQIILHRPEQKS